MIRRICYNTDLQGEVKFLTGGIVRDPFWLPGGRQAADPVKLRGQQYSLDGRGECAESGIFQVFPHCDALSFFLKFRAFCEGVCS